MEGSALDPSWNSCSVSFPSAFCKQRGSGLAGGTASLRGQAPAWPLAQGWSQESSPGESGGGSAARQVRSQESDRRFLAGRPEPGSLARFLIGDEKACWPLPGTKLELEAPRTP